MYGDRWRRLADQTVALDASHHEQSNEATTSTHQVARTESDAYGTAAHT